MPGMHVQPDELQRGDLIVGEPDRIVRSIQKTSAGHFVVVACESGPDYFAEVGKKLWIVRG